MRQEGIGSTKLVFPFPFPDMRSKMSSTKRKLFSMLIIVGTIVFLYQKRNAIADILSVFAYAFFFLIILSPLCTMLEKQKIPRCAAAILSLTCVLVFIFILFSLFLPYLFLRMASLLKSITPIAGNLIRYAIDFLDQSGLYQLQNQSFHQVFTQFIPKFSLFAAREGVAAASYVSKVFFAFVLTYYLLCERSTLSRYLQLCFPLSLRPSMLHALQGCKHALLSYLSGATKTSLFVSSLMYVCLLFLGIENAFLLAFLMGILEIFPYIGPILGSVPVILSALPHGLQTAGFALILILLVQQIESSIAGPYFTASSTAIQPLAALISVFILGSLFGVWGIILAIPLLVTIRSLIWTLKKQTCTHEHCSRIPVTKNSISYH